MAKRAVRRSPKATASRKKSKTGRKVSGRAAAGAVTSTPSKSGARGAKKAGVAKIVRKAAKPKTTLRSGTRKAAKVTARSAKTRPTPIKKASPTSKAIAKRAAKPAAETRAKKVSVAPPAKVAPAAPARPKAARPKHAPKDPRPIVQGPPSSLDMVRRGTAARTGRAEIAESRADHATMTPSITGGDVDASVEDACFTGDEAPGGDNTTPDQDIVDDIGKALGVEYQDNEELRGSDKVADRDKHRWELDPASAEDYRDRK